MLCQTQPTRGRESNIKPDVFGKIKLFIYKELRSLLNTNTQEANYKGKGPVGAVQIKSKQIQPLKIRAKTNFI